MIKLIVFDLWRTLAYRDVPYHSTRKMYEELKPKMSFKKFKKTFEKTLQTCIYNDSIKGYEVLCEAVGSPKQKAEKIMKIRVDAESKAKLYDFTIPLLKKLKKNYKIGLLSNSTPNSIKPFEKKLLKLVDYPFFSFIVDLKKPNPKVYHELLNITGFKPEETLMIGDNKENDFDTPKKLGLTAIHFKNIEQLKKSFEELGIVI
ncbi:MAG: HAD family hydrolase [Nanoarchaeota archaeon]|nr:HAD family hydrolase [Nanoarchaeota archaeon]